MICKGLRGLAQHNVNNNSNVLIGQLCDYDNNLFEYDTVTDDNYTFKKKECSPSIEVFNQTVDSLKAKINELIAQVNVLNDTVSELNNIQIM